MNVKLYSNKKNQFYIGCFLIKKVELNKKWNEQMKDPNCSSENQTKLQGHLRMLCFHEAKLYSVYFFMFYQEIPLVWSVVRSHFHDGSISLTPNAMDCCLQSIPDEGELGLIIIWVFDDCCDDIRIRGVVITK